MQADTTPLTILVTGTNRGLGKHVALQLLQTLPNSRLLFTSRKTSQQIKTQCSDLLAFDDRNFTFKQLNLGDSQSIEKFVEQVKQQKWQFDAIINNAAMGCDYGTSVPEPKWARDLLYTNVIGTIRLTNLLLPYLKQNGRVVNVSSKLGGLKLQSSEVQHQFSDPKLEEQQIFTAVQEYIALCGEGDLGKWFKSAYGTSKMLLNAWSRFVLPRKLKQGQHSIAMSPGHCATDMGGPKASHSAQSGAKCIRDCIFMSNPDPNQFYHRGTASQFVNCGPQVDSIKLLKSEK